MKSIFERMCISLGRVLPNSLRRNFFLQVKFSGKKVNSEFKLGLSFFIGLMLLLSCLTFVSVYSFQESYLSIKDAIKQDPTFDPDFGTIYVDGVEYSNILDGLSKFQFNLIIIGVGFAFLLLSIYFSYSYYFYISELRSRKVDRVLPDALSLISSNMTSGLTAYHAVKSSIRDDFGPLSEAFEVATNKSLGKKSFKESLLEISDEIRSTSLERSMKLFASAIESGSNVASLLKNLAQDVSERQSLKNALVTSTKTNSMFIMFMVVAGGPLLMAVAIFFVTIVGSILGKAGNTGSADVGGLGMGTQITITPQFLTIYAYVFLFITGLLVCFFTGVMLDGDGKNGLKKAPLIIGLSYLIFVIAQYMINSMLGGMF